MELAGWPIVVLQMSAATSDPAVFAYLEDVAPDGTVTYITEGQLRAMNRKIADQDALPYDLGPATAFVQESRRTAGGARGKALPGIQALFSRRADQGRPPHKAGRRRVGRRYVPASFTRTGTLRDLSGWERNEPAEPAAPAMALVHVANIKT